jgi:hypothetical protein
LVGAQAPAAAIKEDSMATSLQTSVKNATAKIAQYVDDAATMEVITNYVEVGGDDTPKLGARTIVRLDGDSETTVPLQKAEDGVLGVDEELFAVHQQNVDTAIEYRARMLESLLTTFRALIDNA